MHNNQPLAIPTAQQGMNPSANSHHIPGNGTGPVLIALLPASWPRSLRHNHLGGLGFRTMVMGGFDGVIDGKTLIYWTRPYFFPGQVHNAQVPISPLPTLFEHSIIVYPINTGRGGPNRERLMSTYLARPPRSNNKNPYLVINMIKMKTSTSLWVNVRSQVHNYSHDWR